VEVAVAFHAAINGQNRVVDSGGEFAACHQLGVSNSVARTAVNLG
jgi:hypothetical protein